MSIKIGAANKFHGQMEHNGKIAFQYIIKKEIL